MKTYHKVYIYDCDPAFTWESERRVPQPLKVVQVIGEDGKFTLPSLAPNQYRWYKITTLSGPEEEMAAHSATEAPTKVSYPRIEVYKGRDGIWRYHLRGHDGTVSVTNPEKFARKWTAKRGANRFNKKLSQKVPVVVLTPDEIVEASTSVYRKKREQEAAQSD